MRFFSDRRCLEHRVPTGFPEVPSRLEAVLASVERSDHEWVVKGSHPDGATAILAAHEPGYVRRFEAAVSAGELFIDTADNPLSHGTWRAARAAVDTCLHATDWVCAQEGRKAVALVRPPGHHAERSMAMGFCYFNNIAVVAEYLLSSKGYQRLAIVDFDVHHGNGTQHIFEERGDVLYASLHQHPFYPGTGNRQEKGRGAGMGATVNVPLAAGSGDAVYQQAFEEIVLPAVREFRPEVLLVSAGFDACESDPVGGMKVTCGAFEAWGRWLGEIAGDLCHGRVVVALEGGYDISGLGDQLLACCRGLVAR